MINESDILPFSTSELPDGPWLVFSPHPDDETFGMGGTLLLAKEKNLDVFLVMVTNGQLGGGEFTDGAKDDDAKEQKLVQIRNQELEQAAQLLGIKKQYHLNLSDRNVLIDDQVLETIKNIIQTTQAASIFFPSILEPHPDHRATAHLVASSVTEQMHHIAFYGYDITVQNPINTLIDISEVHTQKVAVMSVYQSQTGQNNYIDVINALNKSRTYTLDKKVAYAEGFFHYQDFTSKSLTDQVYKQFEPFWLSQREAKLASVSIIIRTYNRPDLLNEALKSLTQQTYPELEVIIVNDEGESVDAIVDSFQSQFSKVIYCPLSENTGRSHAANKGLQAATGDFILFLDDDDIILPEHISVLVKSLSDNPQYRVAYTGTKVEKPDDSFIMSDPYDIALLRFGNFLPIHSVLFKRDLLSLVSFDETLELYEDWDFWLQIAIHADFLHINDHVTAIYRSLGDSGVGALASTSKQNQAKLKVLQKWSSQWSAGEIQDIFNALAIKHDRALSEHQNVIQENAVRMAHQLDEIESLKVSNDEMNQINHTMNEANKELIQLNSQLSEDNSQLSEDNSQLSEDNSQLHQISNTMNEANKALIQLNGQLTDDNSEAQRTNQSLRDELNLVYHSRSWKLLKPLRFMRRK